MAGYGVHGGGDASLNTADYGEDITIDEHDQVMIYKIDTDGGHGAHAHGYGGDGGHGVGGHGGGDSQVYKIVSDVGHGGGHDHGFGGHGHGFSSGGGFGHGGGGYGGGGHGGGGHVKVLKIENSDGSGGGFSHGGFGSHGGKHTLIVVPGVVVFVKWSVYANACEIKS